MAPLGTAIRTGIGISRRIVKAVAAVGYLVHDSFTHGADRYLHGWEPDVVSNGNTWVENDGEGNHQMAGGRVNARYVNNWRTASVEVGVSNTIVEADVYFGDTSIDWFGIQHGENSSDYAALFIQGGGTKYLRAYEVISGAYNNRGSLELGIPAAPTECAFKLTKNGAAWEIEVSGGMAGSITGLTLTNSTIINATKCGLASLTSTYNQEWDEFRVQEAA